MPAGIFLYPRDEIMQVLVLFLLKSLQICSYFCLFCRDFLQTQALSAAQASRFGRDIGDSVFEKKDKSRARFVNVLIQTCPKKLARGNS